MPKSRQPSVIRKSKQFRRHVRKSLDLASAVKALRLFNSAKLANRPERDKRTGEAQRYAEKRSTNSRFKRNPIENKILQKIITSLAVKSIGLAKKLPHDKYMRTVKAIEAYVLGEITLRSDLTEFTNRYGPIDGVKHTKPEVKAKLARLYGRGKVSDGKAEAIGEAMGKNSPIELEVVLKHVDAAIENFVFEFHGKSKF